MDRENYKKNVEQVAHNHYMDFVDAYDEVVINDLSDEDLQVYHDLCQNGVIGAGEELKKRGYGAGK